MDLAKTLSLAVTHHQAGRLVEAHRLYKQVLAIDPDEPDALRLMGQLAFTAGNPAGAIDLIRRAISFRPNVVDYHIDLARICATQRDYNAATESYARALQLDPFVQPQIHLEQARVLSALGQFDQAIRHAQFTVEKELSADALGLLGELMLTTGACRRRWTG